MQNTRTRDKLVLAEGGAETCVAIDVPHQGRLTRFQVLQRTGPLDGFTAEVYDREDACSGTIDSSNPDDPYQHGIAEAHRIYGPLVAAASAQGVLGEQLWVFYENRDELPENNMRQNRLYVKLTPAGVEDKYFLVVWTTTRDN